LTQGIVMHKRRYRSKYLLNRRYRRIRRVKFAAILLLSVGIIAGGVYWVITYAQHAEIHPTKDIKLGDDD